MINIIKLNHSLDKEKNVRKLLTYSDYMRLINFIDKDIVKVKEVLKIIKNDYIVLEVKLGGLNDLQDRLKNVDNTKCINDILSYQNHVNLSNILGYITGIDVLNLKKQIKTTCDKINSDLIFLKKIIFKLEIEK